MCLNDTGPGSYKGKIEDGKSETSYCLSASLLATARYSKGSLAATGKREDV